MAENWSIVSAVCDVVTAGVAIYAVREGTRSYRQSVEIRRQEMLAVWEERFEKIVSTLFDFEDPASVGPYETAIAVDLGKAEPPSSIAEQQKQRELLIRLDAVFRFFMLCDLEAKLVKEADGLQTLYAYYLKRMASSSELMAYAEEYYQTVEPWMKKHAA